MTAVGYAAELPGLDQIDRAPRYCRHAVITLLAVDQRVAVAERGQRLEGEELIRTLGLLQAENVRLLLLGEPFDDRQAQPDRVDVPGRDGKGHFQVREGAPKTASNDSCLQAALLTCPRPARPRQDELRPYRTLAIDALGV